jgi:hypothetical protein
MTIKGCDAQGLINQTANVIKLPTLRRRGGHKTGPHWIKLKLIHELVRTPNFINMGFYPPNLLQFVFVSVFCTFSCRWINTFEVMFLWFMTGLCTRLLSINVNIRIFKTIILSAVLYGCETGSLTLKKQYRLSLLEKRVLRRISG